MLYRGKEYVYGCRRSLEFEQISLKPNLQLFLNQKEYEISFGDEDVKRDITILMTADQDIQFKVNTLIIHSLTNEQVPLIDWLLLKLPNLIDLQIHTYGNFNGSLQI